MRFIHTADWHLGRLFFGEHLTNEQGAVLKEMLRAAKEERAEAIIIAGDIYDRAVPPVEAVELLDEVLFKLIYELKIKVIMISGNHDSPVRLDFASRIMRKEGLFVAGKENGTAQYVVLNDEYGEIAVALFPYAEPSLVRNIYNDANIIDEETAMQRRALEMEKALGRYERKIAAAHAFIAGGAESDSERPLSVGGSFNVAAKNFRAFNYTALGHLHNMQQAGDESICYSGSLMKYSFDEAKQKKGVRLVEIDKAGKASVKNIYLPQGRDVRVIEGDFAEILENRVKYPASDDYICVKLNDARPILDLHRKLRQIYPNFMCVERPTVAAAENTARAGKNFKKMTELELFGGFFAAMTGNNLAADEAKIMAQELDKFYKAERGEK